MAFLDFTVEKSKTYYSTNKRIAQLLSQVNNPRPALTEIGAVVYKTTMNRFVTKRNPGGQSWKRNTPTTLHIKKYGARRIKGRARPGFSLGVWDDDLRRRIFVDVKNNEVTIGTRGVKYAPYFHYGVTNLQNAPVGEGTSPWAEIPARPFLGITRQDNRDIINVIKKHLGFQ